MPANYKPVLLVLVHVQFTLTIELYPNSIYRNCAAQSWESYAESYCFIKHTYYVAWEDDIPMDSDKRTRRLTYYQWVRLRPIGPSPSPTLLPLVTTTG